MQAIADIAVPRLAEMCVIDLLREDGATGDMLAVARPDKAVAELEGLRSRYPLELDGEHPVARAIRSREPVITPDLTDERALKQIAPSQAAYDFVVSNGYRSMIVMPLVARNRSLGALSLFYGDDGLRRYSENLALMRDLADRAATALDNANMYAARTHLARTLQRSLLPETLPALDQLALSSAYHPVGEGNEVGGDFYDVFTTPLGCWLVVGDVCGKGPEAAAVTALVRHSIRAFAFVRPSPSQVLGAVNEVMLGHALAKRFATVVLARLELGIEPARAVIAVAGHPPPVLLDAKGSSFCPCVQGMMLGVRSGSNVSDLELALQPGSTLVLYTDGLLDAGAPRRGLTPGELCRLLARHAGSAPSSIVQQLERLALSSGAGRLRDDVAIVAARVDG
jgi:serine phosphatase RsbU (regulator of sigma subunit)